jgi:fucose permease
VLAPTLPALVAALLLLGAGNGALDVAMNAQAVAVESRGTRPIMSWFHGMWSLGGLTGAAAAAAALASGTTPAQHVGIATIVFTLVATLSIANLLPPGADAHAGAPRFARPTKAVLGLGAVAFFALLSEGAIGDWSALYLERSLGTTSATAALGYAAFALTMASGRFLGDALVARYGDERVVRHSTAGATIGLGMALLVSHPLAAIAGFATVGFGLANLIPIVFRAAGGLRGVASSQGIAAVGTFGYVGFLAGPPAIGLAAEALTLPVALGLVVAALAWISCNARHVRPANPANPA